MDIVNRVTAILVPIMAALLVPAGAEAKELSAFNVCGASGCTRVKDPAVLATLIRAVEAQGEPVSIPTPPPSPFVRLEFFIRGDPQSAPTFRQYYVPARGAILLQTDPNAWAWVSARNLRAVLDRITRRVTPYAKPIITAVAAGATVFDRNEYPGLFTTRPTTYTVPNEPDWVDIKVETREPSPWSTTAATLAYSPSTRVLWRGSEFVKLDQASDNSFPWAVLFGGLGGAAVVFPAAYLVRRRRAE
jgi:hypothetical protein